MSGKRIGAIHGGQFMSWVVDPGVHCKCGVPATHLLTAHATDYCGPGAETVTEFMCNSCVELSYQWAARLLHPANGESSCRGCDLPFVNLCDIIVSLIPIPKAGS